MAAVAAVAVVVAWITQHARTSLARSLARPHAIVQTETHSTVHRLHSAPIELDSQDSPESPARARHPRARVSQLTNPINLFTHK